MSESSVSFVEVCVYEVKPDKTKDFERLIERVADHHRQFPGTRDVRYMKRTHRPGDFASARRGEPSIRLRKAKSTTYVLYWELDNEFAHGKATKSGLERFFTEFRRCLMAAPKIILGTRIE